MPFCWGPPDWREFDQGWGREWLQTNGLGGMAYQTVINANSRLYHGVLVAATDPPAGRTLLLAALQEQLWLGGRRFPLYAAEWEGGFRELGGLYRLTNFRLDPFPVFTYQVEDVRVDKKVFMVHGSNATVIRYRIRGAGRRVGLQVTPLVNCRPQHLISPGWSRPFRQEEGPGGVICQAYQGGPALHLQATGGEFRRLGKWHRGLCYPLERERGEPDREDHYVPGEFYWETTEDQEVALVAADRPLVGIGSGMAAAGWEEVARHRPAELWGAAGSRIPGLAEDAFAQALVVAADSFVARDGEGSPCIVAGYPWFGEWGRDTLISLPGLCLVTGRDEVARKILRRVVAQSRGGLVPNRLAGGGQPAAMNSVDASLWLFWTVDEFLRHTGDDDFVRREVYPALEEVIEAFVQGSHPGIRVAEDGLVEAALPGVQLTWMDARVGDEVITPRRGKPVEVNALWYNALRVMEGLARRFGGATPRAIAGAGGGDSGAAARYAAAADRAGEAFGRRFWNAAAGCLGDVVLGGDGLRCGSEARDGAVLRPNQLLAVSLPHGALPPEQAKKVVRRVVGDLYTTFGPRTLDPADPAYRGRHQGSLAERDRAYHQGTVWPWLMGPLVDAYLRHYGRTPETTEQARGWLRPFRSHLREAGLGTISETFDGDPPHWPRGCVAQAWSVAEVLRVYAEHGLGPLDP